MKKPLTRVLLAALMLATLGGAGLYLLFRLSALSAGDLIRYGERRLEGHPRIERRALPAMHAVLAWLDEPTRAQTLAPFTVPPLPANPMRQGNEGAGGNLAPRGDGSAAPVGGGNAAPGGGGSAAPGGGGSAAPSAGGNAASNAGGNAASSGGDNAAPGAAASATERLAGRILRVGALRAITKIGAAARLARDGDTIEIDAGDYRADSAVWDRAEITIRGVGASVRLIAAGAAAEGKAIWVIRRGQVRVENIEFTGARVGDRNGAGIRFEDGRLTVVNCLFHDNQNGLLTANSPNAELEIVNSEFAYNGTGAGLTHNLYVGRIKSLKVSGSYFHHANGGHLLKSRAAHNLIAYNRLSDEAGGRASYELEFPNGGTALVIGNIIHQGARTTNWTLVSFGAEGYVHGSATLILAHNTLVNDRTGGGNFVRVWPGAQRLRSVNNLFVGPGGVDSAAIHESTGDVHVGRAVLAQAGAGDYRLPAGGRKYAAVPLMAENGIALTPDSEYVHPRNTRSLRSVPTLPGAVQARP